MDDISQPTTDLRPEYSLYSQAAINLATVLGSIIAGSFLLASNLKKLNRTDEVLKTYFFGIITLVLVLFITFKLPIADKIPGILFELLQVGLIYLFVQYKIGKDLKIHSQRKGNYYSKWRAAGISLLCLPIIIAVGVGVYYLTITRVNFKNEHYVYYESGANKDDAKALGNYLIEVGFFGNENPIDVKINKAENAINVYFVLSKDAWLDPEIISSFTLLRLDLVEQIFQNDKINIILCDEYENQKKIISE
jgi:hypothetical protein